MKSWQRVGAVVGAGMVAVLGTACSDDGARLRTDGTGGAVAVAGSSGASGAGQIIVDGSGGSSGSAGSAGAASLSNSILGAPLELIPGTGLVPYAIGPNPYGIRGGGFLARSAQGNTIEIANEPGKICISGTLAEVPGGNYSQYWGVEIGFNLNQGAPEGGAGPSDAGTASDAGDASADAAAVSDAAPAPEVAQPWHPGNVIGFSFVIEGPTINLIRVKSLPEGADPALEANVYCKTVNATSGVPEEARFSELTQYCWSSSSVPVPTALGLDNFSWQLPADVSPAGERPFDWCLKDLRPILAP